MHDLQQMQWEFPKAANKLFVMQYKSLQTLLEKKVELVRMMKSDKYINKILKFQKCTPRVGKDQNEHELDSKSRDLSNSVH